MMTTGEIRRTFLDYFRKKNVGVEVIADADPA